MITPRTLPGTLRLGAFAPEAPRRIAIATIALLALILASCGIGGFNEGRCRNSIEASPIRLDGEQVVLNNSQVDCGAQADLWDAPQQQGVTRSTAHITPVGRSLKFDDDVAVTEPGHGKPYVQVRGEFPVQVLQIVDIRDGEDQNEKLVEVRLGIQVSHNCFPQPLPLMGVRKGKFSQDINPVVRLRLQANNNWVVDRLMH
jgi:hypothetical protein